MEPGGIRMGKLVSGMGDRVFQIKGTACAKALKWNRADHIQELKDQM